MSSTESSPERPDAVNPAPRAGQTVTPGQHHDDGASRRAVLAGTGVAVVAAGAGFAWYAIAKPPARPATAAAGYAPPVAPGGAAAPLSTVAEIPENGGVVVTDQAVVITRESGDTVHAFSAICTHQGCLVSGVANGVITCPCHGSTFDAVTGAVVAGPAPTGLPAVPVTVTNGSVLRK